MGHENHHRRHKRDANPATTQVSVVYVTASKTFDGPIVGYSTLGGGDSSPTSAYVTSYYVVATVDSQLVSWLTTDTISPADAISTPTSTSTSAAASTTAEETTTEESSAAATTSSLNVDTSSVVTDPSTTLAKSQTSVLVASSTFQTSTAVSPTAASSSSSSTALATTSNNSSGLSAGGIVGIIIGIFGFAAAALIIFICAKQKNKKKKKVEEQAKEQEKEAYTRNDILAAKRNLSNAAAPQLNALRPMTQFSPNLRGGNGESIAMGPTSRSVAPGGSPWERNMSQKMEMNKQNPFGTHAAANSNEYDEANPFGNHAATPEGEKILEGAAIAGAAGALARRSSKDLPNPLDLTKSANVPGRDSNTSPTSSIMSGMTSNSSAVGGSGPKPSIVHRVQIDFHPSLADEIELTAGQLVRLLMAYDDGWCQVVRLDGAAKGICPRTCLSNRPIKPRPRGPQEPGRPMTPNQRLPIIPQTQSPSSQSSQATNTQSPMRPMAPGQARPMTPSSGGQPMMSSKVSRPQSPAMMNQAPRSMSPAGARPVSPASSSGGSTKALPMSPGENRSGSPSVGQNQTVRKNLPGPSPMNPAASSLSLVSSAPAEHSSFATTNESSIPETSAQSSPANPLHPSHIPLPSTPVGRKPVPGQAL